MMPEHDVQTPAAPPIAMQFLNFGLPRTGTQTIADTLEMLGYGRIYHMREVHQRGDTSFWAETVAQHYGQKPSQAPSTADFDHVLGQFGGVCDWPAAPLVAELLDAYPQARLILSIRDEEAWVRSMKATIIHHRALPDTKPDIPGRKVLREYMTRLWGGDFDQHGVKSFHAHNHRVREEAAKRGRPIFEVDVTKPGAFQRMCEWLGRPPPEDMTDFPRSDDWRSYKEEKGTGEFQRSNQ